MARSKKDIAVATLKKEIRKKKSKMRAAMRRIKPARRKSFRASIQRLDTAYAAISVIFDDAPCLAFDDSKCSIFGD